MIGNAGGQVTRKVILEIVLLGDMTVTMIGDAAQEVVADDGPRLG